MAKQNILIAVQDRADVVIRSIPHRWADRVVDYLNAKGVEAGMGADGVSMAVTANPTTDHLWTIRIPNEKLRRIQPILDEFYDSTWGQEVRA